MCNQEIFTKWQGCLEKSPVNEMLPSVGKTFWLSISQQWKVRFTSDYYRLFLGVISTNWYKNLNHLNFALCSHLHNQLPPQNKLPGHQAVAKATDAQIRENVTRHAKQITCCLANDVTFMFAELRPCWPLGKALKQSTSRQCFRETSCRFA